MYEITYLDIEENPEYEQIIKDVIKECYKEEHLENSKLTVQITLNGHSFKRELSYMVVHSFYHLMGYDHIEEKR